MTRVIVAAAGQSRRMGRPKALLELRGRPFLLHIVEAVERAGLGRPLVAVASDDARRLLEAVAGSRVELVVNPDWPTGMLSSYQAGARRLDAGRGALLWPVDHPLIAPETLAALVAAGDRLAVPTFEGKSGHPLHLPARLVPALLALPPQASARALLEHEPVAWLPVADRGVVIDVDTPADYAALLR